MDSLNHDNELILLRHANRHLHRFFARFSEAPVLGTEEEVAELLQLERTLHSISSLLNDLQKRKDRAIHDELAIYRANLLRLRDELTNMQDSALACQGRLLARQKHLHAAQAWCAAARVTN